MSNQNLPPDLAKTLKQHGESIDELKRRRLPPNGQTGPSGAGTVTTGRSVPISPTGWTTSGPGITEPLYWAPSSFAGINAAQDLIITPGAGPGGHLAPHVGPEGIYVFALTVAVPQGTNGGSGGAIFQLTVDAGGANVRTKFATISFEDAAYFAEQIRTELNLTCWLPAGAPVSVTSTHDSAAGASCELGGVVCYLGPGS